MTTVKTGLTTNAKTHLSSVLGTEIETSFLSTNDMVIGTDEEKALVKALKSSFPD